VVDPLGELDPSVELHASRFAVISAIYLALFVVEIKKPALGGPLCG
jgi:hypothetical protein